VGPGGLIMAAPITMRGKVLAPGAPIAVFQAPISGAGLDVNTGGGAIRRFSRRAVSDQYGQRQRGHSHHASPELEAEVIEDDELVSWPKQFVKTANPALICLPHKNLTPGIRIIIAASGLRDRWWLSIQGGGIS
jgi:hypothetical protein